MLREHVSSKKLIEIWKLKYTRLFQKVNPYTNNDWTIHTGYSRVFFLPMRSKHSNIDGRYMNRKGDWIVHICYWRLIWPMRSNHSNTDGRHMNRKGDWIVHNCYSGRIWPMGSNHSNTDRRHMNRKGDWIVHTCYSGLVWPMGSNHSNTDGRYMNHKGDWIVHTCCFRLFYQWDPIITTLEVIWNITETTL